MVAVMAEYQIEVVEYVTDPRTGLPRTSKWLPSIAEVVEACDAAKEAQEAQKRPVSNVTPLGKPTPPSRVNPRMWDDVNAKARHERSFTKSQTSDGGSTGFKGLDGELAKISSALSRPEG
jgi:hypothetical protein